MGVETMRDVNDPYALKPGRRIKRRKNKRRKSKSRKVAVDVNENIKSVIAKAVDYNELGHDHEKLENAHNKSIELLTPKSVQLMESNDDSNGTPTLSSLEMENDEIEDKENENDVITDFDVLDTTDLDEINSLECVKDSIGKIESGRTSGNDTDLLIAEIENEIKEVEKKKNVENEMDDVLQPVLVEKEDDINHDAQTLPIFNTFD